MSTPHTPRFFIGLDIKTSTVTAHSAKSFSELVRSLTDTPQVLPVTYEQFHKLPKTEQSKTKCMLPYLTPCTFPETHWKGRTNEHAQACNLVFYDIDNSEDAARLVNSPELLGEALPGLNFLAYRTTSNTPGMPRIRVMLEAQGIPPARYVHAVKTIAKMLGLQHRTKESETVSQPMFVPSMFKGENVDFNDPRITDQLHGLAFTEADIVEGPIFPETSAPSTSYSDTGDAADGFQYLKPLDPTASLEIVTEALGFISPDIDYPEWFSIACALRHQFCASTEETEKAYQLFDSWSGTGSKYINSADTLKKWRSIKPTPIDKVPVTIGSLFKKAKEAGWNDPRKPANGQLNAVDQDSLLVKLDKRRLHLSEPPAKPVTVYSLAGQHISTAGNITVISAQAKAGKTAVMGAMNASVLGAENEAKGDFLGFTAAPHSGKAVIYFDTEQAPYDAWTLLERAAIRAACESWPENFRFYSLADIGTPERRKMIKLELERSEEQCGGIHSVFVDGVADLCLDPNDAEESFGLVEELQHLAIKHHCPLITVLHENPSGAETGKTRGHLGSQLERKAESNLRVVKDSKGICTIYSERCRRASIPKEHGPNFTFDAKAGMHLSYKGDLRAERLAEKRRIQEQLVNKIFQVAPKEGFLFEDLKSSLMLTDSAIKDRTARRRINEWKTLFLVHVCPAGKYQRSQSEGETPRESGSITP
jgi:hypothetical protein